MATFKVSIVLHLMMEPKERILNKAHELFNRYSVRSVSMDDIAAQAGMSKKTVYQYYTDKEELVDAVLQSVLERNKGQCLQDQKRAENAVHEVFLAFDMIQETFTDMNPAVLFDLAKYHPTVYRRFQDFKNGFLYNTISANIEKGIQEELYRPEVDVDIITRYRIESVTMAFNPDVFPDNRTHLLHIEQQLLDHFLYGLATIKGHKLIQKYKQQRIKI
ncbi:MAG: TetR/AcrR family transcriptional regulator [Flavisolibacter sp.]|nr:TetR/AcrR family transcriptional regulator [Flavisolibacter sp.]